MCCTKFEDEIIHKKTLANASLNFIEPWALANEIMLNIMQNSKFDFLENEFSGDWVYILGSISRTLDNFFTALFWKYGWILELKSDTSILLENGSFVYKTCFGLAALFVKSKIYFYRCNFAKKQINKNS